jgi:hypothetical protein
MCFSATASFATAACTGLVGVVTLARAPRWQDKLLAGIPLIFALQQAIEGALWLALARAPPPASLAFLASGFAVVALVVWPSYGPLAVGLAEPQRLRKRLILALLGLSLPASLYGAMHIASHPYAVCIVSRSLSYRDGQPYPPALTGAYILCTCLPLILTSQPALRWFGAIVIAGLLVSAIFYYEQSFSVWCFFAASGSIVLYAHFAEVRRLAVRANALK